MRREHYLARVFLGVLAVLLFFRRNPPLARQGRKVENSRLDIAGTIR
jgi:hypothetical protein